MLYTIYMQKHHGGTANEVAYFEAIFNRSVNFISEKTVQERLDCATDGINIIPCHDSIRIVELDRSEHKWNLNPGSVATGREIYADVIGFSQRCFLLGNVRQVNEVIR